jgi:hypothetical protein
LRVEERVPIDILTTGAVLRPIMLLIKGSIALTTNQGIASWGKVFNDDPMIAGAMLDRLLHRSVVLNIDGDSYRMRSHRARAEASRRAVAAAPANDTESR